MTLLLSPITGSRNHSHKASHFLLLYQRLLYMYSCCFGYRFRHIQRPRKPLSTYPNHFSNQLFSPSFFHCKLTATVHTMHRPIGHFAAHGPGAPVSYGFMFCSVCHVFSMSQECCLHLFTNLSWCPTPSATTATKQRHCSCFSVSVRVTLPEPVPIVLPPCLLSYWACPIPPTPVFRPSFSSSDFCTFLPFISATAAPQALRFRLHDSLPLHVCFSDEAWSLSTPTGYQQPQETPSLMSQLHSVRPQH